jgi:type IX secretion system PorP/SprF family membrane protein
LPQKIKIKAKVKAMIKELTQRILVLLFFVTVFSGVSYGQQDAQYTQFMYNKLPQNAAYTGAREVLSIRALYRDQWSGGKNGGIAGAPKTTSFSIHSPLKNEHFALGFWYVNDRLGLEHKNQFQMTYAYRLHLGKKVKLSLGLNAGLLWYKLNAQDALLTDPNDPAFSQNVSRILPDVGAGLYIYHPNFYFGASVPNFIKGDLTAKNQLGSDAKRTAHMVLMAGGVIPAGKVLKIRPQIQYRYLANAQSQIPHTMDFNLSLLIYDRVNIGGQYRTSFSNKNEGIKLTGPDSFDFMLEVWPTKQLMIGYGYDYTLTKLANFNRGSHEIILGYDFAFEKKKVVTPRYF